MNNEIQNRIISISTVAFDGHPLEIAFEYIACLGATHVELAFIQGYMDDFDEKIFAPRNMRMIRRWMRNVGLDCYAVSAHMNLGNKGVLETFKGRMNFATELGAKIIISNAALRGEDKAFFDNIERIEEQANDLDLVVALENPGDGRENILNCAKEGAQIISRLGVPWIRLNYDFGNVISHFNGVVRPEFDFQDAIDYTAHYHIKDVTGDEAGWHFTEVGTGSIDWSMILPTLVDSDIPFSLEVPLRFMRLRDGSTKRSTVPVDLEEIKRILSGSLAFVQSDRG